MGLAALKGWAEVYRKPIAAVSALEAVAAQSRSSGQLLAPVLDARRGQVYFATYRSTGSSPILALDGEERVVSPNQLFEVLKSRERDGSNPLIVTPVPELLSTRASLSETTRSSACGEIQVERVSAVLAPHVGQLGRLRAQQGQLSDALTLDANYVRRSDAELNWKASTGT